MSTNSASLEMVPLRSVQLAPNQSEVLSALSEEGYLLVHSFLGSFYCLPTHRIHPAWKGSEHEAYELNFALSKKARGKELCKQVNEAMQSPLPANMPLLIARHAYERDNVNDEEIQTAITQFWAEFWNNDYTSFNKFCKKFSRSYIPTHGAMVAQGESWTVDERKRMLEIAELKRIAEDKKRDAYSTPVSSYAKSGYNRP